MLRCHHVFLFLLVCTMTCGFLISPATVAADSGSWEGKVRPGFMTGNSDVGTDAYLDILLPLYGDEQQLFFFNPNFRFDDSDGNEQNIGFGYRRLSSCDHFIVGGNAYYDTMKSETGHRYEQWGFGAELLSRWVDLRANYYNVFGDDVNILGGSPGSGSYSFSGNSLISSSGLDVEEALDGYDAEVSLLIPGVSDFMESRVAATYYSFDADYGKDPDGWRGRLEIRPVPAVNLSLEYRDDNLRGTDTFFGGYLEIPFSMENLFSGKNPFAGAGDSWAFGQGVRELEQRMTDKVVRDRHIVAVRTETLQTETIVDDTIIFVNQDNQAVGDGSYENPYQSLDSVPADAHFAPGAWIYVFSSDETADTYANTHFTLLDDMVLWGQGYQHPVYGLGGGPMPILDGGYLERPVSAGGADPVISLANNNEIMGLTIQHGLEGIYVDTYQTGRTSDSVNIHHNIIRDNFSVVGDGSGIHIQNIFDADDLSGATLTYVITNNLIDNNDRAGINLRHNVDNGELVGATFETVITGNTIVNEDTAVRMDLYVDGSNPTLIQDVTVTNRIEDNIIADSARGLIIHNTLNARSSETGAYVANINSQISNTIRNNTVSNFSDGYGLYIDNQVNAQTYQNSLVQQARIDNLVEGNVVNGASSGMYVNNSFFSGGDFNDVSANSRLSGNTVAVQDPIYSSSGMTISNRFTKNGTLAQGPIAINVLAEANSITDLSSTQGMLTGFRLLGSARTFNDTDDYVTAVLFDFGGGALGSAGGNSFIGFEPTESAFINSTPFSVMAENNWWETTDETLIDGLIDVGTLGGTVDYEPFLASEP